jgi:hypothetical protein
MSNTFGPKGWRAGDVAKRFADVAPSSYDADLHTVEAVISKGSPVKRFYGTEVLRIGAGAVDLSRLSVGIPLLDSHQSVGIGNALGKVSRAWFANGALMGQLKFNKTPEGRKAEGMVSRNEIAGISAGYSVEEWQVTDLDGNIVDERRINFDDDLTFTATRWSLHEASLVSVPADAASMVRSLGSGVDRLPFVTALDRIVIADIRARMLARHRISIRQRMYDRSQGSRDE